MSDDALTIDALMGAKKRLEQIAYPELKPDEIVVGYTCKQCGRVQPYLRNCPHIGPDLLERYPGRVSVDVASIFESDEAKMNEVEASRYADLFRRTIEPLTRAIPSTYEGITLPSLSDIVAATRPPYDNIGAQLGQAIGELIDDEGERLLRVVSAIGFWGWGDSDPPRSRFVLKWLLSKMRYDQNSMFQMQAMDSD